MASKGRITVMLMALCLTAASFTLVFHSMNALMAVGGYCAEGGAYVIRQHCPSGTVWTLAGGMLGAIIGLRIYVTANSELPGPHLEALAWPALFLCLGVPFLLFGRDPAPGETSTLWIVLGITMVIVGLAPALLLLRPDRRRRFLWADAGPPPSAATPSAAIPLPPPTSDDLAASLLRLTALHDGGSLTDEEFAAAKRQVLGEATP